MCFIAKREVLNYVGRYGTDFLDIYIYIYIFFLKSILACSIEAMARLLATPLLGLKRPLCNNYLNKRKLPVFAQSSGNSRPIEPCPSYPIPYLPTTVNPTGSVDSTSCKNRPSEICHPKSFAPNWSSEKGVELNCGRACNWG